MSNRKRQRRLKETEAEVSEHVEKQNIEEQLTCKADNELFTLDTVGSKSMRRRISKTLPGPNSSADGAMSRGEQVLMMRIVSKQQKKEQLALVDKDEAGSDIAIGDLWGSSEVTVHKKAAPVRKGIKTPGPIPGQSYNPSGADHAKAITAATAAEVARRAQDAREKGATDCTMSEATKAVIVDDDDEASNGDSDDDSDDDAAATPRRHKQKEKLTRAQRNKKRNRAVAEHERQQALSAKRLQQELNNLPSLLKAMRKDDRVKAEKAKAKAEAHRAKKEEEAAAVRDHRVMSHRDAGCVPLSDELGGSMRKLVPRKGALLQEEISKLQAPDVQEVMVQGRRRRRGGEKNPYAGKNVKWIPKYKYV